MTAPNSRNFASAITLRQAFQIRTQIGVCPQPVHEIISGWGQYSDTIKTLPFDEREKIFKLADLVVTSFSTNSCPPLGKIGVVGHADRDFHGAEFEMKVSNERATTVAAALAIAIKDLWNSRGMGVFPFGAIAFDPPPHGVGTSEPAEGSAKDRTRNRRVDVTHDFRGSPTPNKPDPTENIQPRLARCLQILEKRGMPAGPVQTDRVKCIFRKLKNNLQVDDQFVDGDLTIVRINGQFVNGLQDINRNYGFLSQQDFEQFFSNAKPIITAVTDFSLTASEDSTINAMNGLDVRIQKAIGFIDAHLGINGIASDNTKVRLNDFVSTQQQNQNSIYSCQ